MLWSAFDQECNQKCELARPLLPFPLPSAVSYFGVIQFLTFKKNDDSRASFADISNWVYKTIVCTQMRINHINRYLQIHLSRSSREVKRRWYCGFAVLGILVVYSFLFTAPRSLNTQTKNIQLNQDCSTAALVAWATEHGADIEKVTVGDFLFEAEAERGGHWMSRIRVRRGLRAKQTYFQKRFMKLTVW